MTTRESKKLARAAEKALSKAHDSFSLREARKHTTQAADAFVAAARLSCDDYATRWQYWIKALDACEKAERHSYRRRILTEMCDLPGLTHEELEWLRDDWIEFDFGRDKFPYDKQPDTVPVNLSPAPGQMALPFSENQA